MSDFRKGAAKKQAAQTVSGIDHSISLLQAKHSTVRTVYRTASRQMIDFDRMSTSNPEFTWFQHSVPSGGADVRLRNETDGSNLIEILGVATAGIKTTPISSLPTGKKFIAVQHRRSSGAGRSRIQGAILYTG